MSETKRADSEAKEIVAVTAKAYPHTSWIESLKEAMFDRILARGEVIAIIEASIFEEFIERTLPEMKGEVDAVPEGMDKENAKMFLLVAADFANGWAHDLTTQMQRSGWVLPAAKAVQ